MYSVLHIAVPGRQVSPLNPCEMCSSQYLQLPPEPSPRQGDRKGPPYLPSPPSPLPNYGYASLCSPRLWGEPQVVSLLQWRLLYFMVPYFEVCRSGQSVVNYL